MAQWLRTVVRYGKSGPERGIRVINCPRQFRTLLMRNKIGLKFNLNFKDCERFAGRGRIPYASHTTPSASPSVEMMAELPKNDPMVSPSFAYKEH